MLVRWTQPAADDLLHICDYTAERFGAAQAAVWQTRSMKAPPLWTRCRTVADQAASPTRGR